MEKIISITLILLIGLSSFAQDYDGVMLVFNDKFNAGSVYKLQDILDTDTVKTNLEDLVLTGFSCSSVCQIDWEVKHKSNILSSTAKHYIKICAKRNYSKLYFDNIRAINNDGRLISLGSRVIRIKIIDQ